MGNSTSEIEISGEGLRPGSTRSGVDYYSNDEPPAFVLNGETELRCTMYGSNMTIRVESNLHELAVIGPNNHIIVEGTDSKLRIEGAGNRCSGGGENTEIYSDDAVTTNELTGKKILYRLKNENGEVAKNVPALVQYCFDDKLSPADPEKPIIVKYAYTPKQPAEL